MEDDHNSIYGDKRRIFFVIWKMRILLFTRTGFIQYSAVRGTEGWRRELKEKGWKKKIVCGFNWTLFVVMTREILRILTLKKK